MALALVDRRLHRRDAQPLGARLGARAPEQRQPERERRCERDRETESRRRRHAAHPDEARVHADHPGREAVETEDAGALHQERPVRDRVAELVPRDRGPPVLRARELDPDPEAGRGRQCEPRRAAREPGHGDGEDAEADRQQRDPERIGERRGEAAADFRLEDPAEADPEEEQAGQEAVAEGQAERGRPRTRTASKGARPTKPSGPSGAGRLAPANKAPESRAATGIGGSSSKPRSVAVEGAKVTPGASRTGKPPMISVRLTLVVVLLI